MVIDYSKYKYLKIKPGAVTIVTLNRPEQLNALNLDAQGEVCNVFEMLAKDEAAKCIILTGAGDAFCAGGDIRSMKERPDMTPVMANEIMGNAKKLLLSMIDIQKPIVAAVNGVAAGLGATLALFSDIVIASEKAVFSDAHIRMGLVPGDGGTLIWPILIGLARAKEYLMTGNRVAAREAERIGLVNKVVPPEDLMKVARQISDELANGPTLAIGWTKYALNLRLKHDLDLLFDTGINVEMQTFYSADHKEAITAFLEKRKPKFNGR